MFPVHKCQRNLKTWNPFWFNKDKNNSFWAHLELVFIIIVLGSVMSSRSNCCHWLFQEQTDALFEGSKLSFCPSQHSPKSQDGRSWALAAQILRSTGAFSRGAHSAPATCSMSVRLVTCALCSLTPLAFCFTTFCKRVLPGVTGHTWSKGTQAPPPAGLQDTP